MIGIYIYLITLFVRPQDWPTMFVYNWPINSILLPLLFLIGMATRKKPEGTAGMPQHMVMIILLMFAFVSNVANGDTALANEQTHLFLIKIVVFYIFLYLPDSFDKLRGIGFFLILMALFISFQGMYQTATGVGWAEQGMHGHAAFNSMEQMMALLGYEEPRTFWIGDWDGPNVMALCYVMAAPYCLEYIFSKEPMPKKIFGAAAYGCLIVGVHQSGSRGGFLGLLASGMLFILLRFGIGKGVMLAAFLAVGVGSFAMGGRMGEMNTNEASARERSWLWERGMDWAREKPFVGMGKGSFANHAHIIAHSNYVENMAEIGFAGFYFFIAALYFSGKAALLSFNRRLADGLPRSQYHFSRAALISLCGFCVSTFFVTMQLEILFMILGICGACLMMHEDMVKDFRVRSKDLLYIGGLCIMIYTAIYLIAVKEVV